MKKSLFYSVLVASMIALLYLATFTYSQNFLPKTGNIWITPALQYRFYEFSTYALLFGLLLNWRGLREWVFERRFGINSRLIPSVVIGVLGFIPYYDWFLWFGIGNSGWRVILYPMKYFPIHIFFTFTAGILLVESFVKHKKTPS